MDELERRLSNALHAEADAVTPRGTAWNGQPPPVRRSWPTWLAIAAAVAAVAVGATFAVTRHGGAPETANPSIEATTFAASPTGPAASRTTLASPALSYSDDGIHSMPENVRVRAADILGLLKGDVPSTQAGAGPTQQNPLADPMHWSQIVSARRTADGQLSVAVIGAVGSSSQPCGEDYFSATLSSRSAVAVYLIRVPYDGPNKLAACGDAGQLRNVIVKLDGPIGDRIVVDVFTGERVEVR